MLFLPNWNCNICSKNWKHAGISNSPDWTTVERKSRLWTLKKTKKLLSLKSTLQRSRAHKLPCSWGIIWWKAECSGLRRNNISAPDSQLMLVSKLFYIWNTILQTIERRRESDNVIVLICKIYKNSNLSVWMTMAHMFNIIIQATVIIICLQQFIWTRVRPIRWNVNDKLAL